jgi:hypothetical protein
MGKRLHACLSCGPKRDEKPGKFSRPRGLTRHDDRLCGQCRRAGAKVADGVLTVPIVIDPVSYLGRGA